MNPQLPVVDPTSVANKLIDALKDQPSLLVLVVLYVLSTTGIILANHWASQERHEELLVILEASSRNPDCPVPASPTLVDKHPYH